MKTLFLIKSTNNNLVGCSLHSRILFSRSKASTIPRDEKMHSEKKVNMHTWLEVSQLRLLADFMHCWWSATSADVNSSGSKHSFRDKYWLQEAPLTSRRTNPQEVQHWKQASDFQKVLVRSLGLKSSKQWYAGATCFGILFSPPFIHVHVVNVFLALPGDIWPRFVPFQPFNDASF